MLSRQIRIIARHVIWPTLSYFSSVILSRKVYDASRTSNREVNFQRHSSKKQKESHEGLELPEVDLNDYHLRDEQDYGVSALCISLPDGCGLTF